MLHLTPDQRAARYRLRWVPVFSSGWARFVSNDVTQASLSAAGLTTPVDNARLRNLFHSFVSGLFQSMKWIA